MARYRVISYRPDHEVVLTASSGPLQAVDKIVVTGGTDGSSVSYEAAARLRGRLHLLGSVLRPGFRTVAERAASGLAQALSHDQAAGITAITAPGVPVRSGLVAPPRKDAS